MAIRQRMSAAEFFQLPETNQPTELIDGELIVSPAPVPEHQSITGEFYVMLRTLIPNGKLYFAPIDVYFDEHNVPQPDIVWVAENSKAVVTAKRIEGPPDLIIEIASPGTSRRDKKEKYRLYQKYGVREYWMADPMGQWVEVWVWKDGAFVQQGVYGPDESFESPVLGGKTVDLRQVFGEQK